VSLAGTCRVIVPGFGLIELVLPKKKKAKNAAIRQAAIITDKNKYSFSVLKA
jgi:hypothetical protein